MRILFIILQIQCSLPDAEDITAPVVVILYPYQGSVLSESVTVSIESSDDRDIKSVWYYLDGELMNSSSHRNPKFDLNLISYTDNQTHVIQAAALDEEGNIGYSAQISVLISESDDIEPPEIILLYPVAGSVLSDTAVTIALDVIDDNTVAQVEFFFDGGVNGNPNNTLSNPPWNHIWDISSWADSTDHTLYIKAYDSSDNVGTHGPITFTNY